MLTQELLKELLKYDPLTGKFTRKVTVGRAKNGDIAGTHHSQGYIQIMVEGKLYLSHRLAWFYTHGYFPENDLDHINKKKNDNRLKNLREASKSCNLRNASKSKNNTSGITGVSWNRLAQKWVSQICINSKVKYLGRFKDFTEAVCHRLAAEQFLDWSSCN